MTIIVRLLFFSLLPTLCALSTEILFNCSFSLNKFCKISSVCSHVSFSTSAIPSILRLSQQDLSSKSLCLSQSWSLSFQSSSMSSLCSCFCLLRLLSTFWNFVSNISWDVSKLILRSTVSLLSFSNLSLLSWISSYSRSNLTIVIL